MLTSITPLDGRYNDNVSELSEFVSEYALIKTRVEIEAKYLLTLSDARVIRRFTKKERDILLNLENRITISQAEKVKKLEKETRHDVKAVEKILRTLLEHTSLKDVIEMIHFGLTSEDINNLSYRLMLRRATQSVCIPALKRIVDNLVVKADEYKSLPMLARTHGQAAVPTTLGKELVIFAQRLHDQILILEKANLTGKLNGAVGNYNALHFAYPKVNWIQFSKKFTTSLGLVPNLFTTQINPYDDVSAYFQTYQRINSILIDLNQDMWRYISDHWFVLEVKKNEVGSSTMPQKVNPIDFENSEGNLGMANSLLEFLASKLMISRLQRDLSDSTVIRNIGTVLGYSLIGYKSTLRGLTRIKANVDKIDSDLSADWAILTEGVQTLLRKFDIKNSYSLVKSLVRGKHIDKQSWNEWVLQLPIKKTEKEILTQLTPQNYIGLAIQITKNAVKQIKSKTRS